MRYAFYALLAVFAEVVSLFTCWVWPWFAVDLYGPIDNRKGSGEEPRLPGGLAWLDTPDNSLLGDKAHKERHANSSRHWQMTCWLARNRAYGFKWIVLSAPVVNEELRWEGDLSINRNSGHQGVLRVGMGEYWEYKKVKRLFGNYGIQLDFGWLLNVYCEHPDLAMSQPKALFQFSPRPVRFD